ncbi:hypothetical protein DFJ74DRAFT_730793, partial [Hyaloraphidium curvatum]
PQTEHARLLAPLAPVFPPCSTPRTRRLPRRLPARRRRVPARRDLPQPPPGAVPGLLPHVQGAHRKARSRAGIGGGRGREAEGPGGGSGAPVRRRGDAPGGGRADDPKQPVQDRRLRKALRGAHSGPPGTRRLGRGGRKQALRHGLPRTGPVLRGGRL